MQYVEIVFLPCQLLKKPRKNAKIITVIGISIGVFCHIVLLFQKYNSIRNAYIINRYGNTKIWLPFGIKCRYLYRESYLNIYFICKEEKS